MDEITIRQRQALIAPDCASQNRSMTGDPEESSAKQQFSSHSLLSWNSELAQGTWRMISHLTASDRRSKKDAYLSFLVLLMIRMGVRPKIGAAYPRCVYDERNDKVETNTGQCPLCGSELSRTKFHEIQQKRRDEQKKRLAEMAEAELAIKRRLGQEFKKELEQASRAAEKKAGEQAEQRINKVLAEREQLAKRVKESEAREAEILRQAQLEIEKQKQAAAKKATQEAEQRITKVTAERDLAAKKLKEAQESEAEIRKLAQEEAEKRQQKELTEQRQALEKDKKLSLLKLQSEFNRERESYRKKTQLLETQLQRKTANELGDGGEIDVYESLREAFDGNGGRTTRIPKGQSGADLLHEVFHKGEICGRIIVDAKIRQAWQNSFVTKLRQDQVEAGAEHAILATTVFPAGKKEMCIESGVIVISPARVVHIVQLLRQAMITMHVKGLSMKERMSKMSRLYKLITSEPYVAKFTEASRLTKDILDLDAQEKTAHDNVWKKRGALAKRMQNVLREVETEVAAVIEGEEEGVPAAFVVEGVAAASSDSEAEEAVAWSKR